MPRCQDSGATAVEFAVVFPLLVAVLFGAIDGGRLISSRVMLTYAVGKGARIASLSTEATPDEAAVETAINGTAMFDVSNFSVTTYNGTIHTRKAPNSTLSFSFAAFGDAADKYSGELPQAESVNARVATLGVPFVMLLGDNIYPSGTHDDMDAIFETAIVPTKSHVRPWL